MNAFLRRVVAQRELEQEAAIIATSPEQLLRWCRICGAHVRSVDGEHKKNAVVPVCLKCGGSNVAKRIEQEDREAVARASRFAQLLSLAGLKHQPQPQESTMADRNCSKCGKKLHWKNKGGECPDCRPAAPAAGGGQGSSRAKSDVVKRFKVVASALGVDPDNLIAEFCEGWLERVRTSANFGNSSSDA